MARQVEAEGTSAPPLNRRGLYLAVTLLIVLPLLLYGSMVFRGWEPKAPDTGAARPFGIWGMEAERQSGQVPLWYPYIFSGMPSYGSLMYTPRSPINPIAVAQSVVRENRGAYYVFLLIVAGLANFAFIRRQGCSRLSSCTGALLYSLTPYFMGNVAAGHSTKLEALALLPVLLLAIDLFLHRPDLLSGAALAAAATLLAWSSHPQIAYYGLLVGFLYALGVLLFHAQARWTRAQWARAAFFLLLAVALCAALAAEPYLAVREYMPYSIRGGGSAEGAPPGGGDGGVGWEYATAWSFHPAELISFLFPAWFGLQGQDYWGKMPFTQSTHYFGILALGLALFALWRRRDRKLWIWAGISLIVLIVGFGRYLPIFYGPMYRLLPFFNKFRVPSMIYGVLPLCLGPLVAGGLDALMQSAEGLATAPTEKTKRPAGKGARPTRRGVSRRLTIAVGAVVACWILISVVAGSRAASMVRPEDLSRAPSVLAGLAAERNALLQGSVAQGMLLILAGLICLLLVALKIWPRKAVTPWLGLTLAVLTIGDIFVVSRRFYHVEPKAEAKAEILCRGAADFLARQPGAFRILPLEDDGRGGIALSTSNSLGLLHLQSIAGYQPAKLQAYQDLLGQNLITRPAVLGMLNVRYILSSSPLNLGVEPLYQGDGYVYPYADSLPRAWAISEVKRFTDSASLFKELGSEQFHPQTTALLYTANAPSAQRFAPARVTAGEPAAGRLSLKVESSAAAFVVVSEIAFPPGWRAKVNGRAVPLYRVDHVLLGVEVPPGSNEVSLSISSPAHDRGIVISRGAGWVTVFLALVGLFLRRRPRRSWVAS